MLRRDRVGALVVLVVALLAGPGASASPGAAAPGTGATPGVGAAVVSGASSGGLPAGLGRSPVRVTLVTGDRVTLRWVGDELSIGVEPGPGREDVRFRTDRAGDHVYVVPSDATGLLAAGRLDRRLFDVAGLVAAGYDDTHQPNLRLIIRPDTIADRAAPGDTAPAPVPEATVAVAGGEAEVLPEVGVTTVRQPKDRAGEFWAEVVGTAATARSAGVGAVWLDGVRHPVLDESVPQVGAPHAWEAGYTGAGVRVAVLDSGIDVTHPDLVGRVVQARNFTAEPDTDDLAGHGTHVASTVGGTGAASGGSRRGVAPDAELLNGKVCDGFGGCYESEVLAGMQWAAESGARVVNLSLGGPDTPEIDPLEAAVDTLSATHGMLFVVAAGNEGPSSETVSSPASADAALAVGAVDDDDQPADFSSRGPRVGDAALKPEITAPGVGIVAARARNGWLGEPVDDAYASLDGTSMATPHVAGAAALVAQQHPDWTGAQIRALLVGSAHRVDGVDANTQGAGRLDVGRAVDQVVTADPAVVSAGRTVFPHGDDGPIERTITYRNPGAQAIALALAVDGRGPGGTAAPDDVFDLGVESVTVPAGGEASVELTVDTSVDGPDGAYSAWVTATGGPGGPGGAGSAAVVTTPVVVDREPESYDLTVELVDRDGSAPEPGSSVSVVGLDNAVEEFTFEPPGGTATYRLPRGRYVVNGDMYDGGSLAVVAAPGVDLDRDQTIEMDARTTEPVDVTLEREDAVFVSGVVGYRVDRLDGPGRTGWWYILGGGIEDVTTGQVGPEVPDDLVLSGFQGTWAVPDAEGDLARSERSYELAWFERGRLMTGLTEHVRERDLARTRTTYRATGPDRVGYHTALAHLPGGEPISLGSFAPGLPLPLRRTVLHNTEGIEWSGVFDVIVDPEGEFLVESSHYSPPRRLRPGATEAETWNPAVHGPLVSAVGLPCAPTLEPSRRTGDAVSVSVALLGDGDGHPGCTEMASGHTRLLRNGIVVGESSAPGAGEFTLPPGTARYRLEVDQERSPGAHLSTRTTAAWTFRSAHIPGDEPEPLPLLAVRWTPHLDDHNRAPAGRRIEVPVTIDRLGAIGRVHAPTIEASFDDGATWNEVPVRPADGGHDGFVATIRHPAGAGFVSLRASARDDRGNTVEQTTIRAYELAPDLTPEG